MELGIIEGYFGTPWSWEDRTATMAFLAPHGYRFFHYAPKADARLRRNWRERHPDAQAEQLARFAAACRDSGVRFGIGLSPFEAWLDFGAETRAALAAKLAALDEIGVEDLAILFDDMKGDLPDLADRQADIVDFVAGRSGATRLFVCPSYYSDDPVLDRVFGRRPDRYLETLGRRLDPAVGVFWTGEEVCSREFGRDHLERIGGQLGRAPVLWDNYPVNDGERMSQFLHLRGFSGRPAGNADLIRAHAVNPALQPHLTRVPAITLSDIYRTGDGYSYGAATAAALRLVLGERLAEMVRNDLLALQDVGLDRLGDRAARLRERYAPESHPAAVEIIRWLDGGYRILHAEVQTQ